MRTAYRPDLQGRTKHDTTFEQWTAYVALVFRAMHGTGHLHEPDVTFEWFGRMRPALVAFVAGAAYPLEGEYVDGLSVGETVGLLRWKAEEHAMAQWMATRHTFDS